MTAIQTIEKVIDDLIVELQTTGEFRHRDYRHVRYGHNYSGDGTKHMKDCNWPECVASNTAIKNAKNLFPNAGAV